MSLDGTIRLASSMSNTLDNIDLSTPNEVVSQSKTKTIDSGVVYHDTISLSANQIYTLDIGNDSLNDVFGNSVAISGVTSLYIAAGATNGGDFTVSGGANAFLNDQPALGAGEALGYLTDIDVTTNSKIYFVNGATSGTVDIIVSGDE